MTGAAILLQSWREATHRERFTSAALRDLLSQATLNTASEDPSNTRIGVMPDLRRIIEAQDTTPNPPGKTKYLLIFLSIIIFILLYVAK